MADWQRYGKHILATFWQCQCDERLLTNYAMLSQQLIQATQTVGLTIVGQCGYEFADSFMPLPEPICPNIAQQGSGVTLTLLLAESHLCLHTWGEYRSVTLDIYVCNVSNDNSHKADNLLKFCQDLFLPASFDSQSIWRKHQP